MDADGIPGAPTDAIMVMKKMLMIQRWHFSKNHQLGYNGALN